MLKLYYCQMAGGNVGDDFNAYFWRNVASEFISVPHDINNTDYGNDTMLVGIGTLLWNGLPEASKSVVFATGTGYNNITSSVADWDIYCVRGPLTAKYLGIDASLAIGDGAYLLNVFKDKVLKTSDCKKRFPFSLMLHHLTDRRSGHLYQEIAESLGYGYISSCSPPEVVFSQLQETEILITEAMHGAIFADILRVPWVPISTNRGINQFKWVDFCSSVALEYKPHTMAEFLGGYKPSGEQYLSNKRKCLNAILSNDVYLNVSKKVIRHQLKQITKLARPQLSSDDTLERVSSQLFEKFELMRANYS